MDKAQLFEAYAIVHQIDDLHNGNNHEFVDFEGVLLFGSLIANASEVLQTHHLFVQNLMQNFPYVLIPKYSILLN